MPTVSILIPAYNVEKYLPQCLDSVLSQTFRDLQIVVIDDGSKDGTWHVMKEFAARDNRIEIYHQENQGVAETRNHLLDRIQGDYFLFVDADDWIEPDMIESLLNLAIKYNADIVTCGSVTDFGECQKDHPEIDLWSQEETVHQFLCHTSFNGALWNKLFRRDLALGERFNRMVYYGEDALFCWHVLQRINRLIRTSAQYYHYRLTDTSLSNVSWTPQKKGTGSTVWRTIENETKETWPQYISIASATYAISDMWHLFYAAKSNYPYDSFIKGLQKHVRQSLLLIIRSGLVSTNKLLFAIVISYCYCLGGLLAKMI